MAATKEGKTTINGGDGRVHFLKDPVTNRITIWQGEGDKANVRTYDLPGEKGGDGAALGQGALSATESSAIRWLENLEGPGAKPVIETHSIGGHNWYIYQGNAEDVARAGLWSARDASGRLHLLTTGVFTSFLAGIYHVYLKRGPEDLRPEFPDYKEAYKLAASTHPIVAEINGELFEQIIRLNPALKPKPPRNEAPAEKDDTPPLV